MSRLFISYSLKPTLLAFVVLVFYSELSSQSSASYWDLIDESEIQMKGQRYINPTQYSTFRLDVKALKNALKDVPMERTNYASKDVRFISIPMPDGEVIQLQIEKAPIWEEGYGEKFPDMMTYIAFDPTDISVYAKLDITPQGFHGMIMKAGESTVFIDPYAYGGGDDEHYIVYDRAHFVTNKVFSCGVEETTDAKSGFIAPVQKTPFTNCELKEYRLALAATGEYTAFHGGTVPLAAAAQVTSMNRVNGVYERDLGIRMNIVVNNDLIIYTDGATDPYDNGNGGAMLGQNQTNCDAVIGSANYDIGHVYSTGGGGIASLQSPCTSGKARGVTGQGAPVGDPFDIDYVAHEMGHQFGGNHTQNNACNRSSASVECGSGSSIMGYAGICAPNVQNNSNDHFNGWNLVEMGNFINGTGGTCASITDLTGVNSHPSISSASDGHVLPVSTPFAMTAVAVDAEGDPMSYCWEQQDPAVATQPPLPTNTGGPTFRSLSPTTSPTRYLPNLADLHAGVTPTWEVLPGVSRNMNWKVTVRDNNAGTGCSEYQNVSISFDNSAGPFVVQSPNTTGVSWTAFTSETVTWDVANTNVAPVSSSVVDILLSLDGGVTYPTVLASSVVNDGSQSVTVPNVSSSDARIMVRAADNIFLDVSDNDFTIIPGAANDFTLSVTSETASVCSPSNATFDIQVNQIGAFTDDVTLSFSSLPGSASGSFSTNPVTTPGTSTLTISNISSVTPGSYLITLTGTSSTTPKTVDLTLTVSDVPSGAVSLTSPSDAALGVAVPTNFSWSAISGDGVTYDIDIASDIGFSSIIDNATGLTSNSYVSSGLSANTTYYWRINGSNLCGVAPTSSTFSFTTANCLTFNSTDVPVTISSSGTPTVTSTVNVGSVGTITDVNVVNLNGTHSWINDLTITLTSPNATVVTLWSNICGNENNFNVSLDDEATPGALPCPPTGGGTYQPSGTLADFIGELSAGVWTLTISDGVNQDGGQLDGWGIELCLAPPPSCPPPSTLTATSITSSGATLGWTENGTATAWDIEIGSVPFSPSGVPTDENVGNPFTWSAGAGATTYEYYVRADCDSEQSSWAGPFSFTTANAPIPPINGVSCGAGDIGVYVFTEEFDALGSWTGDVGAPSSGNGIWEIPGDAGSSGTGPSSAFSGANYTNFEASGPSSATADLISPAIDLNASTGEVELSFYMHAYGAAMGTLNVGIGTSATGPFTNVFSWLGELQTAPNDPWQAVGIDLDVYAGQTIYIRFQQIASGDDWTGDMSIDYVRVEQCELAPDCPAPSNGMASNITFDAADLSWTENGTASTYDVEYGPSGFSQGSGTPVNGTSSNPLSISPLSSDTDYEFYVRALCGGGNGNSTWSGPFSFSTVPDYCGTDDFLDSGGAGTNYSDNENFTYTICPNNSGDVVTVTFNVVDIEVNTTGTGSQDGCWDFLSLYDGDSTADPLIAATLCGEESGSGETPSVPSSLLSVNDSFTSTNPNGCLTFTFSSDVNTTGLGWSATVTCAPITCPTPNSLTATTITASSADLGWTESGTAIDWIVDFGAPGFTPSATTVSSSNPENVNSLTDDTDYEFYVRAYCGVGDTSAWAGPFAFSTLRANPDPCVGGLAAGIYPCSNYDLMSQMSIADLGGSGSVEGSDIWGWTDPLDDKEYAIVCLTNATAFVDISDALNPRYLGSLPTQTGTNFWRDAKVYQNHAFIVADNVGAHGMQVFDLTQLRTVTNPQTFTPTAVYNGVGSAHNVAINEATGYAYIVGDNSSYSGGLHFVNIQTPASPVLAGGFAADGYTHDVQVVIYNGPDVTYQGKEIAFASNEDTFTIVDVDDKSDPQQVSRTGYAGSSYTHQGWLTEDHQYFLMNDELDEQNNGHNTRTYVWDILDLDAPIFLGFYESTTGSIDHNNYTYLDTLYQANYTGGLRVLDASDVSTSPYLTEVGYFDIYPANNNASFNGAWSVYPYFDSRNIIVSSIEDGLFILRANPPCTITSISDAGNQTACDPATNTYSHDIAITYVTDPGSGTLVVNGQNFPLTGSPQTVTLTGLAADGNGVDVTALFSDDPGCTLTEAGVFIAPSACPCSIDAIVDGGNQSACNSGDDTYTNDVTITFSNAPSSGLLDVNGQTFAIGSSPQTVTLTGLTADGNTVNVTAGFTALGTCSSTVNSVFTAPGSCVCDIQSLADGGQTACSSVDNTYSSDVIVTYVNAPGAGTLDVNGQSFAITGSPQTVTLTGLNSNGNSVDVTAEFSDEAGCSLTENMLFTAPTQCVDPACLPDNTPPELSAGCNTEDTDEGSYDDGWSSGDGDNTAFGAWNLFTSNGNPSNAGHFLGNSASNGDGDANGDGDVNVGGEAWGLYANSGQTSSAVLPFTQNMAVGSKVTVSMDNGFIDNSAVVGFGIQNSSSENLAEFFFRGGDATYVVNRDGGETASSLGFTDEGLIIEFYMSSSSTIDVTATQINGGAQWTGTVNMINPGGGQIPAQVRLFNFNAGGGGQRDAYFNSVEICHACPPDISVSCADYLNTGITGIPVVTDFCDPSPTLSFADVQSACSGGSFAVTRTFTASDNSGNTATCNQNITVIDNSSPNALCQNVTVNLDGAGNGTLTAAEVDNGSSDACSSVSLAIDITSFDCDDVALSPIDVTLTVTDECGNTSSCISQVTVVTSPACTSLANDDCANAHLISVERFGIVAWDTLTVSGATQSQPGCIGDANDDTWYYFTAESSNDVIMAQSVNGSFDAVIQVYDGCGGTSLGCFNNYGNGAIERVIPGGLQAGSDYYFRVYDIASGSPAASEIRVQVKTFAKGEIRDIYCNVLNYQLDDVITPERQDLNQLYPFTSVYVSGYGVRLINPSVPDTSARYQTGVPSWYFSLSSFANAQVNTSYQASTRHRLKIQANGALAFYWSDWGPDCSIAIGNVPETQIRSEFCNNAVDYGFEDQIQAEIIPFADQYRFIFTDGTNVFIEQNNSYGVFLYELEGLELNTSYEVTVQTRVNGVWSSPGPACSIFMKSQPDPTEVQASFCNGTYTADSPEYILAEYIYGASQYEWQFTPLGGGSMMTEVTSGISMFFHLTDMELVPGETYDVSVRAFAGGLWGDFLNTCSISIAGGTQTEPDEVLTKHNERHEFELSIVPNPTDGEQLRLSLDYSKEITTAIGVRIMDITGKEVYTDSRPIKGQEAKILLNFDQRLLSGIYFLQVTVNGEINTARFIVK